MDILYFVDDTIIFGDGRNDNLWCLKAIFRGFKLMSGLKVNLCKSNIYNANINDRSLSMASSFLTCGIGVLPFKFFGVKVGDNSRKVALWKYVIRNMRSRLSKLTSKFLSIGRRVVLINSVLNSIPLDSLAFFKAPKKVIQEVRSIQSRFLWRGVDEKICVHWINWNNVCKEKSQEGSKLRTWNAST